MNPHQFLAKPTSVLQLFEQAILFQQFSMESDQDKFGKHPEKTGLLRHAGKIANLPTNQWRTYEQIRNFFPK